MASIALRDGNYRMPSPLLCEGSILGLQLVTAAGVLLAAVANNVSENLVDEQTIALTTT